MKAICTLVILFQFSVSFSQWTRIQQLPASDIFSLHRNGSTLYAGGRNLIYFSKDNGQNWDSTAFMPDLPFIDNIIVHKGELYASSFGHGVFKSLDGGRTWLNINAGIAPFVSDFSEWRGELYAATEGNWSFKLDPIHRNSWVLFANGLSNQSANLTAMASTSNTLITGTLANGLYDYITAGSGSWEERFLSGQITPTEGVNDIITVHDSLFLVGSSGRFYLSTDHGLNWIRFGNIQFSHFTSLVNTRQAFLSARNIFNGQVDNVFFSYMKKDSLGEPAFLFSVVPDHFTYKMEIFGDKLWDASSKGLFYMPLSLLPGITADDSIFLSLPVTYISFDAQLTMNHRVLVQWKTSNEFSIDHFEVERSTDGSVWNNLANFSPQSSHEYMYNDGSNLQGSIYYRIKGLGLDGGRFYSSIKKVTIENKNQIMVGPNPTHDWVHIKIMNDTRSQLMIKVFDSKGALARTETVLVLPGFNQFRIDFRSMAKGMYTISAEWNNGQLKKAITVLKQ